MLKQSRQIALLVWVSLVLAAPVAAQVPSDGAFPDTKNMPEAFSIIEQTSRGDVSLPDTAGYPFTKRIKRFMRTHGFIPGAGRGFRLETGTHPVWLTEEARRRKHSSGPQVVRPRTGPEIGTFYDQSGRLKIWVPDAARPGKFRVQDSPPMEELKDLTREFVDWDSERVALAEQLDDLPLFQMRPAGDQSGPGTAMPTAWLPTRDDISLTFPNPVEMQKEAIFQGQIGGDATPPIRLTWWIDGKPAGARDLNGVSFAIPLTFASAGRHLFKVSAVDANGKTRNRSAHIPVTFNVTTRTKSSDRDGGRLSVLIAITGSDGPYLVTWASSDGQRYKSDADLSVFHQRFLDPGQNTISWVDIVVTDKESGIAVPLRVNVAPAPAKVASPAPVSPPPDPCDDPAYRAGRQGASCNDVSSDGGSDNQDYWSQQVPDMSVAPLE